MSADGAAHIKVTHAEQGPDIEAFRAEVRDFVRTKLPEEIRRQVAEERMDIPKEDQRRWHRILRNNGWAVPAWPVRYGGCDWSDLQLYAFEREVALADAPRPIVNNVQMIGPTLIQYGTAAQIAEFLPPIAAADVFWCQGYSEPNAGSDLARIRCRAERTGDEYRINGSKIWTTDAHVADWMFGIFRTQSAQRPQHGITFLMLAMDSPGVTVQPLLTFDGTHEVNQVFFGDVRVPTSQRLGAEHLGWGVAKYLLGLERFGTAEVSRSMASLVRLKRIARETPYGPGTLIDALWFVERLAEVEIELRALELLEQRFLFAPSGNLGAEGSILKIRGTEVQQMIMALTMDAIGYYAHVDAGDLTLSHEVPAGPTASRHAAKMYFNYRKTSIYSGSNEIMKNIVAKHALEM